MLLAGSTGLIGRGVLAALHTEGHEVVAVVRSGNDARLVRVAKRCIALDMAKATSPQDWLPHVAGIDAAVNCAGVLQDSLRDSTGGVHAAGASALFAACEQAGVRRVVQISALGVDRDDATTAFSRSKLSGDQALMARNLEWVILRPSVVVGRQAYGGSALFRGLAALPIVPRVAGAGMLQVVQLDDLVRTVLLFLKPGAPTRVVLEVVGPERLSLDDVLASYRRWLGLGKPRFVTPPNWMAQIMYRMADLIGWLGWRPPLRSTMGLEVRRGVTGDPNQWMRLTGIAPRSLRNALAAEPASVQERWFARLYFIKPLVLAALALFWIVTGLVALGPGWEDGVALIADAGLPSPPVMAAVGATADILIGAGIAIRRTASIALRAALALSAAYLVVGTLLLPGLWADPLGPMLKVLPALMLNAVALAILDDR